MADEAVYAFDAADGTERWRFGGDTAVYPARAVVDGTLYAGTHGGDVYALPVE